MIYEILLAIASFCAVSGAIGVLRLPDVYNRVHASTVSTVGGTLLLCLTLAIKNFPDSFLVSTKIVFLILVISLTAPTANYMTGKAALRTGVEPWRKK